jgi:DNA-binding NarL/FixJ family response regulator
MLENDSRIRLYVIEEQELTRTAFCSLLSHDQRLEIVGSSSSIDEAICDIDRVQPHIVVIKADAGGEPIVDPISRMKNANPNIALMVLSEAVDPDSLPELIQAGVTSVCGSNVAVADLLVGIRATAGGCMWFGPRASGCLRTVVANAASIKANSQDRARLIGSALTEREIEILAGMARGLTNQQIAGELMLSIETVKTYVRRIMDKSSIRTRRELMTCFTDSRSPVKLPGPDSRQH